MADPPVGEEIIIDILQDQPLIDTSTELRAPDWSECCIYRVPKLLRKVNEEAYTPKLISIGPFHHGREDLLDMEMHKERYFRNFLDRTGKSQEDLRKIIEKDQKNIHLCYSEDYRFDNGKFVRMILLDAIFIIELFLKVKDEEEDYILRKKWLANGIYYDLLLLENQLPFFVLEQLYMFAGFNDSSSCNRHEEGKQVEEHKEDMKKDVPLVELFCIYFTYYDQKKKSIGEEVIKELNGEKVKHFTDLLRCLFCPQNMEQYWKCKMDEWSFEQGCMGSSKNKKRREFGTQYCATKLDDAGLKFKVEDDTCLVNITLPGPCFGSYNPELCFLSCISACAKICFPCVLCFMLFLRKLYGILLDLLLKLLTMIMPIMQCLLRCFGFPMHILRVPQLVINYGTEAIFRNLMALEQCHYPSKTYICSYVLLLDRLIDTVKDVDLLVDKKVIANHLSSNADVAALINKLGDQIFVPTTPSYFDFITQQLNDHYEFPLNHLLATLKREYFPNIFRGTTTIVGLIVLGFTIWSFIRSFVNE